MEDKPRILVVYHSQSGGTERMAQAVIQGASAFATVRSRDALQASVEDVFWSDALILGTPENFGYMSGALKCFLDRVYYPCLDKVAGKPYGLFIKAGNDGSGAVTSIHRIVKGLALKEVQDPVLAVGDLTDTALTQCKELGMTMGAGLEAGMF